jgi:capsule biosynthesis phosphatase
MRICIDLDGVISGFKGEGQTYADVVPVPGAVAGVAALKEAGHHIIIHTARHMKTCNGNPSLVMARVGKITLDWLAKYEVPYDEIIFGKPWADVYIDDNAMRFNTWDEISKDGGNLPISAEKKLAAAS